MLRPMALTLGVVIALVAVLAAAGFLFLQTGTGGRTAARLLSDLISTPGEREVRISAIEPGLPQRLALSGLRVSDGKGPWLAIDRLVVDWQPLALLRGRIAVHEAVVEGVRLDRLPAGDDNEPSADAGGGLPSLPLDLAVERFALDDVRIGEAVAGEPVALRAHGRLAAAQAGRIETAVRVVRTNGPGGEADFTASWGPATQALSVDGRLDEPSGGLIGTTLGLTGKPPVRLSLAGDGPLDGWRGRVSGAVGDDVRLEAEVHTEATPAGIQAHATGRADVAPLLDEPWRALAADGVAFDVALRRPDGAAVHVDTMEVSTGGLRLAGGGIVDPDAGRIDDATIRLIADPGALATLSPLLAPASLRALELNAAISGPWAAPSVQATGTLSGLGLADAAVERTVWDARIKPAGGESEIVVNATATFSGVQAGTTDLGVLLGDDPRLAVDATLERATKRLVLDSARLETPALSIAGAGAADLATGDGEATLRGIIADLSAFSAVTGLDLAGNADLAVSATSDHGERKATVRLETDGWQTGVAPVDAALGRAPVLRGSVSADAEGSLRLDEAVLSGDNVRVDAAGTLVDSKLRATYQARIGDLAPVAAAAGVEAQGALSLEGTLSGDPADPSVEATAVIENGRIDRFAVAPARAELAAERLATAPRGTLEVTAAVDGDPLRARVPFAAADNGTLAVGPFEASAPGAIASGTLRLPPGGSPVEGEIKVRTGAGGTAARVAGLALSGESTATVRLGTRGREQTMDLAVGGRSLALTSRDGASERPAASADSLSLRANLAGPQGRLGGRVEASATGLAAGAAVLDRLEATVSGSADAADFTLSAQLPAAVGGAIRGSGMVQRAGEDTRVVLRDLDGRIGDEGLALRQPMTLILGEAGMTLADLDLAIGGGGLTAGGTAGAGRTEASLAARDLPLTLATAFRPGLDLAGTVNATGALRSQGGALVGDVRVEVEDLRTGAMIPEKAVDLTATARLDGRVLAVEADSVIAGKPLVLAARVPARVDAQTRAVRVPPQAPLSGRVRWSGPVAELWELLPLPDQRLTGAADIDLRLGGTIADPRVEGAVTLDGGRYENFVTATVIEDLAASARADGGGTVALALRGNDGERGTITGDGAITIQDGAAPVADLTVRFDAATLLRRDDVTATLSGTVTFRQSPTAARISGAVTTDRVEVRLIDRLPPSVVVLDVKEINLPPGRPRPVPEAPGEPAWRADLDLGVSMPRRVFVRGRGLESEWQGDLRLTGTTATPVVVSSVSARSGTFDFAGRRFTLERGEIGFTGGDSINPTLNVVAMREVTDLTARITVSGTADAPAIELSSQPALPDSEILARILFGEEVSKLGPVQLAQLGLALDTLASGESLSEDALSYLRGLLGLDVLTVETGDGDGGGPAVGVGRYVADGVYVGARQGIEEDTTAGTVEVEILPGLSVESEVGSSDEGAVGALGLRWRWDY